MFSFYGDCPIHFLLVEVLCFLGRSLCETKNRKGSCRIHGVGLSEILFMKSVRHHKAKYLCEVAAGEIGLNKIVSNYVD